MNEEGGMKKCQKIKFAKVNPTWQAILAALAAHSEPKLPPVTLALLPTNDVTYSMETSANGIPSS